jgi:hypothetical protein
MCEAPAVAAVVMHSGTLALASAALVEVCALPGCPEIPTPGLTLTDAASSFFFRFLFFRFNCTLLAAAA